MKYLYILFIITSLSNLYSQDIILKKNGESIESKIDEIGVNTIKYHKYSNLTGPVYILLKEDVSKITFENGDIEMFSAVGVSNMDKVKKIIIENINEYGYVKETFFKTYKAFFDGDYLRLEVVDRTGTLVGPHVVYDFSLVYKFDGVSKREYELAYINIWVSKAISTKKNIWKKEKLVMRVLGHKNADIIMNAMKEYNRLLNLKN